MAAGREGFFFLRSRSRARLNALEALEGVIRPLFYPKEKGYHNNTKWGYWTEPHYVLPAFNQLNWFQSSTKSILV